MELSSAGVGQFNCLGTAIRSKRRAQADTDRFDLHCQSRACLTAAEIANAAARVNTNAKNNRSETPATSALARLSIPVVTKSCVELPERNLWTYLQALNIQHVTGAGCTKLLTTINAWQNDGR